MDEITSLMMSEHKKIEGILETMTLGFESIDSVKSIFNYLKRRLEEHFEIEENAIIHLERLSGNEVNDSFKILQDHGKIMSLLKKIEQDILQKDFSSFSHLLELWDEHAEFENTAFYPNLEMKLSADRKKEILGKIKNVLE